MVEGTVESLRAELERVKESKRSERTSSKELIASLDICRRELEVCRFERDLLVRYQAMWRARAIAMGWVEPAAEEAKNE